MSFSRFRGKTVLLNFWATWCPPCRREIPLLERLAQPHGRQDLQVLAVAMDRDGRSIVQSYLNKLGIRHLDVFLDPLEAVATSNPAKVGQVPFVLYGMPVSYLIDHDGVVIGYFPGEADWTSEPAQRLLDHVM